MLTSLEPPFKLSIKILLFALLNLGLSDFLADRYILICYNGDYNLMAIFYKLSERSCML